MGWGSGETRKETPVRNSLEGLDNFPFSVAPGESLMMQLKKATAASQSLSAFWKEKTDIKKRKVRSGDAGSRSRHSLQQHGPWCLGNCSYAPKTDRQF